MSLLLQCGSRVQEISVKTVKLETDRSVVEDEDPILKERSKSLYNY